MKEVSRSSSFDVFMSRQWLVRLVQRFVDKPISGVTLHILASFGSTVSLAILFLIISFVTYYGSDTSVLPCTTEWLLRNWESETALLITWFFALPTISVVGRFFGSMCDFLEKY